jgi:hypothetical protein
MELELFNAIAEKLKIPSSNYMFKSRRTGIIYWFMVCQEHYETTILNQFKPGHKRYGELNMARQLHRKLDRNKTHEKILNFMKSLNGITEFLTD